jgi:hypothetical protein
MKIHVKYVYVNGASFFASARGGYYAHTPFSMVEYSKGDKKIYYMGLKQTTKDECNKKYLELKHDCKHIKGKKFEQEITEYDITMEELEKQLMKGYDEYTCYIEDYKQEQEAIKHNKAILAKIEAIKEL